MKTTTYLMLTLAALWLPKILPAAQSELNNLLQKGLFEEEANQNLEAAIKNYQALIQQSEEQRKLVATAVFRLGECYRKQGRTNEAAAQYQRIVSDYSEQTTLANLSRQNLVGLGIATAIKPGQTAFADRLQAVLADQGVPEEEREIQQLQKLLKDSPDLLNALLPNFGQPEPRLHAAVRNGKFKLAEFLLAQGIDINARGPANRTLLHVVAETGNKAMAEFLLTNRANVDARFSQGQTPLHIAAENGHKALAELLLAHKANVNAATDLNSAPGVSYSSDWLGATPLSRAVFKGHQALAELLLKNGADIRPKDSSGRQALHLAAVNGNAATAQLLLANKAELNTPDMHGWTPLQLAVERGNLEMAELLLKNKADVNIMTSGINFTPLHTAVRKGNPAMTELLLKYQADVNAKDERGYAPLHLLIVYKNTTAREQIFEMLLDHGADINARVKSHSDFSPLHMIVERGDQDLLQKFLHYKPAPNAQAASRTISKTPSLEVRAKGMTPLHLAVQKQAASGLRMVEMLLTAGADMNATTTDGNETPLFFAIRALDTSKSIPLEYKQIIELLLSRGAKVNVMNHESQTPLAVAKALPWSSPGVPVPASRPQVIEEVIQLLKNAGANEALDRLTPKSKF